MSSSSLDKSACTRLEAQRAIGGDRSGAHLHATRLTAVKKSHVNRHFPVRTSHSFMQLSAAPETMYLVCAAESARALLSGRGRSRADGNLGSKPSSRLVAYVGPRFHLPLLNPPSPSSTSRAHHSPASSLRVIFSRRAAGSLHSALIPHAHYHLLDTIPCTPFPPNADSQSHATVHTVPLCPSNVPNRSPFDVYQTLITGSLDAVNNRSPSALKTIWVRDRSWP
jgi:hypothetical protein